jgi:microtubule-associated protein-like 5
MNLTEFESILNSNMKTFAIFDVNNNGKYNLSAIYILGIVDALELFTGLIVFSDSKIEDKIKFLFDLFDFNEILSLSLMDLEFLA